jgi:hypothetical protein
VDKKKITTITSETHEVFIVRSEGRHPIRMWCPDCAADVEMLKPEEAAAIANVSPRTIYRWIEAAQIHHCEGMGGNVVVCPAQLFAGDARQAGLP